EERLRLERNLHDGAQQRLFAVQVKLEAARERAADPVLADELREIAGDAAAAVDELRSLAHGLYPTILRERGLVDALRAVARTASGSWACATASARSEGNSKSSRRSDSGRGFARWFRAVNRSIGVTSRARGSGPIDRCYASRGSGMAPF